MRCSYKIMLFLIFCMHSMLAQAGDVYRWVDAKGVVHYSDRASGSGATPVQVKAPQATTQNTGASSAAADAKASDNQAAQERSTAVRADQCAKASKRLETYRAADQLLITDTEGKQREMSPDEKIQAILRAEKQTESFCQG